MKTYAALGPIATHLPEKVVSNEELAEIFTDWTAKKITQKTGISERRIAAADETAADLAVAAAQKLFAKGVDPSTIDFVLFCTQCPDYFLPTSACVIQDRLGIPTTAGALDFNLGCSGFVYGLGLAKGLVESGQASRVLFLTGETYSKFMHPEDRTVRPIFGDAAAACLVEAREGESPFLGPFVYGTDGRGAQNLIVPTGAARQPRSEESAQIIEGDKSRRTGDSLYMNGPEIFTFTLEAVPALVEAALAKAGLTREDVDLFVFHQANKYMLDHLVKKAGIPLDRFPVVMESCGNTVSSTIPIVLERLSEEGRIKPGMTIMAVGFGVGYSWGAVVLRTVG